MRDRWCGFVLFLVCLVPPGVIARAARADEHEHAVTLRGSLEERVIASTVNQSSQMNPDNQVLHLAQVDNTTILRSVLETVIVDGSSHGQKLTLYSKQFGELESSPITYPGTAPTYAAFRLDETYLDWELDEHVYALVGKKRINWGVGFFANPVDAINPVKNAQDPVHTEEGSPLAMVEVTTGVVSASALYLRDFDTNGTFASHNNRVGAMASVLAGPLESKWYAYGGDHANTMVGASLRTAVGDFAIYGEAAVRLGSDRWYFDAQGNPLQKGDSQHSGLVGVNYTFLSNYSVGLEYIYDQRGYDRAELANLYVMASRRPDFIPLVSNLLSNPLTRQYIGLMFNGLHLRDDWDVGARVIADLGPPASLFAVPFVVYRLTDVFTLKVEEWLSAGRIGSTYGDALFSNQTEGYVTVNF